MAGLVIDDDVEVVDGSVSGSGRRCVVIEMLGEVIARVDAAEPGACVDAAVCNDAEEGGSIAVLLLPIIK